MKHNVSVLCCLPHSTNLLHPCTTKIHLHFFFNLSSPGGNLELDLSLVLEPFKPNMFTLTNLTSPVFQNVSLCLEGVFDLKITTTIIPQSRASKTSGTQNVSLSIEELCLDLTNRYYFIKTNMNYCDNLHYCQCRSQIKLDQGE